MSQKADKDRDGKAQTDHTKAGRECLYPAAVFTRTYPQSNITHVKPGDIIQEKREEKEKGSLFAGREKTYRVVRVYPYHVSCVESGTGFLRSFSFGDLITMGLESQSPEIEAKRKPIR